MGHSSATNTEAPKVVFITGSIHNACDAVLSVKIKGDGDGTQWGMLESPASDEKGCQVDGVLIGRTLVGMQKETIPLRVMNLSQELKVLRRGTTLACCEPVVSIVVPRSLVQPGRITGISREATLEEFPGHLQPLFHCCADDLETTEEEAVHQLLSQFIYLFSTGTNDLGCTDLVRHTDKIHTGDAKPVHQPSRRLPLAKREEPGEMLSELQKQGVIEPSVNAWSSPVVLVKKKDGSTQFCFDYRRLNGLTQKDSYPLPHIDNTI